MMILKLNNNNNMIDLKSIDKQISNLIKQKRELYYQQDIKSSKKINNNIELIDIELNKLTSLKLSLLNSKYKSEDSERKYKINMIKEQVKQIKKEKRIKIKKYKSRKKKPTNILIGNNYRTLILKALMLSKLNSEEKVVRIVHEWSPNSNLVELRMYVRRLIILIKQRQTGKYLDYEWDKEKYQVVKSCQTRLI